MVAAIKGKISVSACHIVQYSTVQYCTFTMHRSPRNASFITTAHGGSTLTTQYKTKHYGTELYSAYLWEHL